MIATNRTAPSTEPRRRICPPLVTTMQICLMVPSRVRHMKKRRTDWRKSTPARRPCQLDSGGGALRAGLPDEDLAPAGDGGVPRVAQIGSVPLFLRKGDAQR